MADKTVRRPDAHRGTEETSRPDALEAVQYQRLLITRDGSTDFKVFGLYAALLFYAIAEPIKMDVLFDDGSGMMWLFIALSSLGAVVSLRWLGPGCWPLVREATGMTIDRYAWYRCLVSPAFWFGIVAAQLIGVAVLVLSAWVFTDAFGTRWRSLDFVQDLFYLLRSIGLSEGIWDYGQSG